MPMADETSEYKAVFNAAKFDKILSQMYGDYINNIRDGRTDLQVLKNWENYDTDSSEAHKVKQTITFFKK
jgi:carboxylesterase type B